MNSRSPFLTWFLRDTGGVFVVGFVLALLLSPLVIRSAAIRSRCELALSVVIALLYAFCCPVFSDMPRGHNLPVAVASAFGIAFTISWLRFTHAQSGFGWLCLAFHTLIFVYIIQEL